MSEDKLDEISIYTFDLPPGWQGTAKYSSTPSRALAIVKGEDAWSEAYRQVEDGLRKAAAKAGCNAIIGVGYTDSPILNGTEVIGYSVTMYGHQVLLDPKPEIVRLHPDST